jgi:hypothetical protein
LLLNRNKKYNPFQQLFNVPIVNSDTVLKIKKGGKISDLAYEQMINKNNYVQTPSGQILGTVASIILPLVSSYLIKKAGDKIGDIFKDKDINNLNQKKIIEILDDLENINEDIEEIKENKNEYNDKQMNKALSEKSKSILNSIIKGAGISLLV